MTNNLKKHSRVRVTMTWELLAVDDDGGAAVRLDVRLLKEDLTAPGMLGPNKKSDSSVQWKPRKQERTNTNFGRHVSK